MADILPCTRQLSESSAPESWPAVNTLCYVLLIPVTGSQSLCSLHHLLGIGTLPIEWGWGGVGWEEALCYPSGMRDALLASFPGSQHRVALFPWGILKCLMPSPGPENMQRMQPIARLVSLLI